MTMKKLTYLLAAALLSLTATCMVSCEEDNIEEPVVASSLAITPKTGTVTIGETITFDVAVKPEDAENKEYRLELDNSEVASLDGNTLTALAEGTVTVTASLNELTSSAVITVKKPEPVVVPATSITITPSAESVTAGDFITLDVTVEPEDATDKEYTLTLDAAPEGCATLEGNVLTGVSKGMVKVIATLGDLEDHVIIPVKEAEPEVIPAERIKVSPMFQTIKVGEYLEMSVTVYPENATDQNYTLTVNNPEVASLEGNLLTALAEGQVEVIATLGELTASAIINVEGAPVPAERIKVKPMFQTIKVGEQLEMTVTVYPEDATDKNYTLTVDKPEIASLDDHLLTGLAVGQVEVIATLGELTASAIINVEAADEPTTGITIDPKTAEITVGAALDFTVTVEPTGAADKTFTLSVDNPELATIEGSRLTALAPGTVTVTVTQGAFSDTAVITIVDAVGSVIEPIVNSVDLYDYGTYNGNHSYMLKLGTSEDNHHPNIPFTVEEGKTLAGTYDVGTYVSYYGPASENWVQHFSTEGSLTISGEEGAYVVDATITYDNGKTYHYAYTGAITLIEER